MLSKIIDLFAELYFKTNFFIFIVCTQFYRDVVFIIEKNRFADTQKNLEYYMPFLINKIHCLIWKKSFFLKSLQQNLDQNS